MTKRKRFLLLRVDHDSLSEIINGLKVLRGEYSGYEYGHDYRHYLDKLVDEYETKLSKLGKPTP